MFCDGYIDIAELDVVDGCIIYVNNTASEATYFKIHDFDWKSSCAKILEKYVYTSIVK